MIRDGILEDLLTVPIDQFVTSRQNGKHVYARKIKRLVDVIMTLAILAVLSLPILLLAIIVRLDGHSAFYGQKRVGLEGEPFLLLKLRSMVPDAEIKLERYLAADPAAKVEWEANQKLQRDPRVTAFGRFLRKYSLDELPQLINVLRGEMSLIGPRPMMTEQKALYPGSVYAGLRPGLTGLWQISPRTDPTFAARARFDADYAIHLSLGSDLRIAFLTLGYLVAGRGC